MLESRRLFLAAFLTAALGLGTAPLSALAGDDDDDDDDRRFGSRRRRRDDDDDDDDDWDERDDRDDDDHDDNDDDDDRRRRSGSRRRHRDDDDDDDQTSCTSHLVESRPIGSKKLPDRQRLLYIGKWALRMPQHTKAHLPRRESLPAACFRLPERAVDYGIVRVTTRL